MKVNINRVDRIIRILIAIIANILFVTKTVSGALGMAVLFLGGYSLVTAVLNFCPLYKLLKFSTNKK